MDFNAGFKARNTVPAGAKNVLPATLQQVQKRLEPWSLSVAPLYLTPNRGRNPNRSQYAIFAVMEDSAMRKIVDIDISPLSLEPRIIWPAGLRETAQTSTTIKEFYQYNQKLAKKLKAHDESFTPGVFLHLMSYWFDSTEPISKLEPPSVEDLLQFMDNPLPIKLKLDVLRQGAVLTEVEEYKDFPVGYLCELMDLNVSDYGIS
jgi:hypothetical protein